MQPQSSMYGQHPGCMSSGQGPTHAPPPMTTNQSMGGGPRSTYESAGHFPSASSSHHIVPQHTASQSSEPPPRPDYLIVGLFALRITRHVILQLDPYPGSDAALRWLENFLQAYHASYALAKIKDPRMIEQYVQDYPSIVRRMIKQPRYRRVFMDMNPDKKETQRELNDGKCKHRVLVNWEGSTDVHTEELLAIIDFADAAGEWGSVVPLPEKYAQRIEELAKGRRMAE